MNPEPVSVDGDVGVLLLTSRDLELMISGREASPLARLSGRLLYLRCFGESTDHNTLMFRCPMMAEVEIGRDSLFLLSQGLTVT